MLALLLSHSAVPPSSSLHDDGHDLGTCAHRIYSPMQALHGWIDFFDGYELVRREYDWGSQRHGCIDIFENNSFTRREYMPSHTSHGQVEFFESGLFVRREYLAVHANVGRIDFFDRGFLVRREYESFDKRHGWINFYDLGMFVRREYGPTHRFHGRRDFFENGTLVRIEYAPTHRLYGQIDFVENGQYARREFLWSDERFGIIHFFERGAVVRREFTPRHVRFGEIHFIDDDGMHVRTEYASTHPLHMQVDFFENGTFVGREYGRTRRDWIGTVVAIILFCLFAVRVFSVFIMPRRTHRRRRGAHHSPVPYPSSRDGAVETRATLMTRQDAIDAHVKYLKQTRVDDMARAAAVCARADEERRRRRDEERQIHTFVPDTFQFRDPSRRDKTMRHSTTDVDRARRETAKEMSRMRVYAHELEKKAMERRRIAQLLARRTALHIGESI